MASTYIARHCDFPLEEDLFLHIDEPQVRRSGWHTASPSSSSRTPKARDQDHALAVAWRPADSQRKTKDHGNEAGHHADAEPKARDRDDSEVRRLLRELLAKHSALEGLCPRLAGMEQLVRRVQTQVEKLQHAETSARPASERGEAMEGLSPRLAALEELMRSMQAQVERLQYVDGSPSRAASSHGEAAQGLSLRPRGQDEAARSMQAAGASPVDGLPRQPEGGAGPHVAGLEELVRSVRAQMESSLQRVEKAAAACSADSVFRHLEGSLCQHTERILASLSDLRHAPGFAANGGQPSSRSSCQANAELISLGSPVSPHKHPRCPGCDGLGCVLCAGVGVTGSYTVSSWAIASPEASAEVRGSSNQRHFMGTNGRDPNMRGQRVTFSKEVDDVDAGSEQLKLDGDVRQVDDKESRCGSKDSSSQRSWPDPLAPPQGVPPQGDGSAQERDHLPLPIPAKRFGVTQAKTTPASVASSDAREKADGRPSFGYAKTLGADLMADAFVDFGLTPKDRKFLSSWARRYDRWQIFLADQKPPSGPDVCGIPPKTWEWIGTRLENIVHLAIVANCAFLWYSANQEIRHAAIGGLGSSVKQRLRDDYIDWAFTAFFTAELIIRLVIYRSYFFLGSAKFWNFMDSMLLLSSYLEFIGTVSFLRAFRIFKVAKIARLHRLLKLFGLHELVIMVDCLTGSIGLLLMCLAMICFMSLLFALLLMQLLTLNFQGLGSTELGQLDQEWMDKLLLSFGSVETASFTLFAVVTGGTDWKDQFEVLRPVSLIAASVLVLYVTLFYIAVTNVVTSTFVDKAFKLAKSHNDANAVREAEWQQKRDAKEMKAVFECMDVNCSGTISAEEFKRCMQQPEFLFFLRERGLLIKDVTVFFQMLTDGKWGSELDVSSLVDICLRIRGNATRIDLYMLEHQMHSFQNMILTELRRLHVPAWAIPEAVEQI